MGLHGAFMGLYHRAIGVLLCEGVWGEGKGSVDEIPQALTH